MRGTHLLKTEAGRAVAIMFVTLFILMVATEAMAWQRNISRTGPNGRTASRDIMVNPTGNGYNRSTTVTGPQGNSATREATGQWDPATKTWSKTTTATGASQQSATRSTTVTGTGTGYDRSTTVTGPQGNSATHEVTGQWDPATKTWTKTATTTGAK